MTTRESTDTTSSTYGPHSIQILTPLECIRRRPGMYVGDVRDGSGLRHLLYELVGNAVIGHQKKPLWRTPGASCSLPLADGTIEQPPRRCFRIAITLHPDGAVTIEDDGPGLPLSPCRPFVQETLAEGMLRDVYIDRQVPFAGWYGTGLVAANALSKHLVVEICQRGKRYRLEYRCGEPKMPLTVVSSASTTGTTITLWPDGDIFPNPVFDANRLRDRLRELAFLNPGLRLDLADERRPQRRESFLTHGLTEWVERLTEGQDSFPQSPVCCRGEYGGVYVDAAFRWVRMPGERIKSFVNQNATTDNSSHVLGLRIGIGKALKDELRSRRRLGWRRPKMRLQALCRGLVAVVSVYHPNPDFRGPLRRRLHSSDAKEAVLHVVSEALRPLLAHEHALLDELEAQARHVEG